MSGTVRGEARLRRTLAAAGSDLSGPAFTQAVAAAGVMLADAARGRAPRRSGALAGSIRPAPGGRPGVAAGVAVVAGIAYAAPVEYGVGPRPGLRGGHNIRPRRYLAAGAATFPRITGMVGQAAARPVTRVKGA